jgi:hypothetical protein
MKRRANAGVARILEAIIAASIILIAFSAAAFFVSDSKTAVVQDRSDLDRIGYNVLSKLTESGTIEATIEQTTPKTIALKAFIQNSLPSTMLFNLTVSKSQQGSGGVTFGTPVIVSNIDDYSLSQSLAVSSTPLMYTSKNGSIYYLVLMLANPGQGA